MRPIVDTLRDLRGGGLLEDLGVGLLEVVQAVRSSGKAGKLTLTITVKPAGVGADNALMLSDEVKSKLPRLPTATSVMFASDDNDLTRNDPRQPKLPLPVIGVVEPIQDKEAANE